MRVEALILREHQTDHHVLRAARRTKEVIAVTYDRRPIGRVTERDDARERQLALQRERADVEKRIARLVAAIEAGGDAVSSVRSSGNWSNDARRLLRKRPGCSRCLDCPNRSSKTGWWNGVDC